MFSINNNIKSILFYGSTDVSKSFMFEMAIHWAEEGRRVFYLTSAPLTSIPAIYHDRNKLLSTAFNMIKFIYLANYDELIKELVELHTHAALPSIILIDNLHTYINDEQIKDQDFHIARLCAIIHDSAIACSRIKNNKLHLCASLISENFKKHPYQLYFNNIWHVDSKNENDVVIIELSQIFGISNNSINSIIRYKQFQDGTLILNQIFQDNEDY